MAQHRQRVGERSPAFWSSGRLALETNLIGRMISKHLEQNLALPELTCAQTAQKHNLQARASAADLPENLKVGCL